jgi:hypothetical protein
MRCRRFVRASTWLCLAALLAAGPACVRPVQRSLLEAGLQKLDTASRKVHIARIDVVDARSPDELEALTPDVSYVIFLVLWYQHYREGHVRPEAELYSRDAAGEMKTLLKRAIDKSGLFTPGEGEGLTLKVELKHLYGISHAADVMIATAGAAVASTRTFAAYGFAGARIKVLDSFGAQLVDREVIGYFDPNLNDLMGGGIAQSVSFTDMLTHAAVQAAGHLAGNIVKAIEPAVDHFPALQGPAPVERCSVFYIARAVDEGPFLEIAGVNYETGEIMSVNVVVRWMEPFSATGEWVVDPYSGGQVRLTPEEYNTLVRRLKHKYKVDYATHVRTAHFFGSL